MLRTFWRWLFGPSIAETLLNRLDQQVADNRAAQEKMMNGMFDSMKSVADASTQQSQVLSQYLKLFQTSDQPTSWQYDQEELNKKAWEKAGFPVDKTEKEQAEWVLEEEFGIKHGRNSD